MSKQPEQQDETLKRVLELCTLEPNTTERQLKSEPQMILGFDMPETIMGMSRTELLNLFADIPIGINVLATNYKRFIELLGPRPYGFYTEWIGGTVCIVDPVSLPHESTIGKFVTALILSLGNNYRDDLFIFRGTPPLELDNRHVLPDFSFYVDREFIDHRFIVPNYAEIPTIIGEVAYSESRHHLFTKCRHYIAQLSVDIVMAIVLPKPRIVNRKLKLPTAAFLFIMYEDNLNPIPIRLQFDQEITFQLRTHSLQRKIRNDLRVNLDHQPEFINVIIMLKKDTIFAPEILQPNLE